MALMHAAALAPPSLAPSEKGLRAWYPLILLAVGGAAYFNSLAGAFQFDDFESIVNTSATRSLALSGLRAFGRWTFSVNYALGGTNPLGYHVVNVAIHLAAGLFLFGLVRRSLASAHANAQPLPWETDFAFAVALVWLVHPLNTAAVTYIVQRLESLMGLCFLACLYFVARSAHSSRAWLWQAAALVACVLGLGAKEVMVMVLPVGLLYDRIFLSRSWREVFARRGVLYIGILLAVTLVTWKTSAAISAEERPSVGFEMPALTPWMYLRTEPAVILHYLGLAVWPVNLCFDYGWPIEHDPLRIYGLGAVVLALLAASVAALWFAPRCGFLGLAFFLLLAPTSSFVPLADPAFEHRMYLPLIPVIGLVLLGVITLARRFLPALAQRPSAGWIALGLVVAALAGRTILRNRDYRSAERLWQSVLEQNPRSARAHFFLGFAADAKNKPDEALEHFRAAAEIQPTFVAANYNVGWHLSKRKKYAEAATYYEKVIEREPRHALAQADLGFVCSRLQRPGDAVLHFQKAVEIDPRQGQTYLNWGSHHERAREFNRAAGVYRKGLRQLPESVALHARLGICLYALDSRSEAREEFETALRLDENSAIAAASLAWILATAPKNETRDVARACNLATKAVEVTKRKNAIALDALAAALAARGEYKPAVETAREALLQFPAGDPRATPAAARIKLYEAGQPYRAPASPDLLPATASDGT